MSRVAGSLKKILMLVCGFRVKICLDLVVVAEVYFNIKEGKCLVRRI